MARIDLPSADKIERVIAAGAARGIDAAMATLLQKAERIAPYDVKERDVVHLRAHGSLHKAVRIEDGVQGRVSYTVHNPSSGFSYARIAHEGYWEDASGRHPRTGYFHYSHPAAKRRFLATALRTNRRSLNRIVARSIKAEMKGLL